MHAVPSPARGLLRLAAAALFVACGPGAKDAPPDSAAVTFAPASPPTLAVPATYTGRLPGADGPGIDHTLMLHVDSTFYLRTTFVDRPDGTSDDIGRWALGADGRTLTLFGGRDEPLRFELTSERTIRTLDASGTPITSALPRDLTRADTAIAFEPRLTMRGMYRYMADAATFAECRTGRTFPVAMEADNIALERGYAGSMPPNGPGGEPVLVELEGRLARRPPAEESQGGLRETLVPEKFVRAVPGATCASGSGVPGAARPPA
jgi:copper homeostasis protein (lipoprotein)